MVSQLSNEYQFYWNKMWTGFSGSEYKPVVDYCEQGNEQNILAINHVKWLKMTDISVANDGERGGL